MTCKTGLARRTPGREVLERLRWEDALIRYQKADRAELYVYTRETAVDFPDYYLVDAAWAPTKRLTDVNPQQRDIRWSPGAKLLKYKTEQGDMLKGVLHLPSRYEPGRAYPTIVSIYELQSQYLHQYKAPSLAARYVISDDVVRWTQHGYAVFLPDIQPRLRDPGRAAVECVLAGIKAAVVTGIVNSDRLGLEGQSMGGYETNFIITQTDLFKAAVAKNGDTDLVSS